MAKALLWVLGILVGVPAAVVAFFVFMLFVFYPIQHAWNVYRMDAKNDVVWANDLARIATVEIKLFSDGSANLNMGASDIGTGTKTWAAMIVAEELGVAVDQIQIEHADTGTTQYATSSGGSKTVPTESPAVRAAATKAQDSAKAELAKLTGGMGLPDMPDLMPPGS